MSAKPGLLRVICLALLALSACSAPDGPEMVQGIIELKPRGQPLGHNYAEWHEGVLYSTRPLRRTFLSTDYAITSDTVYIGESATYVTANQSQTLMLTIPTTSRWNEQNGGLVLRNLRTGLDRQLLDTGSNVSSARFVSDSVFIFYSRGTNTLVAGYYLITLSTVNEPRLLFALTHNDASVGGIDGFDVHPFEPEIIIPFLSGGKGRILRLNYQTLISDTLSFEFATRGYGENALWLRYDSQGARILFDNYSLSESELGILGPGDSQRVAIDPSPYRWGSQKYFNIYPNWSPDERSIVFGSSSVKQGAVGSMNIYIARDIIP
jgi:hypothetical protein